MTADDSSRRRLLDLFCGGGGAGVGYARSGFDVTGCDVVVSACNPHPVIEADALTLDPAWIGSEFDAVHASPPCQRFSRLTRKNGVADSHPDLITSTRRLLESTGLPWVLENVPGAPLRSPAMLCGSMFPGLRVRRHRLFETNWLLLTPRCGPHREVVDQVSPRGWQRLKSGEADPWSVWLCVVGHISMLDAHADAMGIDWMPRKELVQSIPPAYTEFIGTQLMAHCA